MEIKFSSFNEIIDFLKEAGYNVEKKCNCENKDENESVDWSKINIPTNPFIPTSPIVPQSPIITYCDEKKTTSQFGIGETQN